MSRESREQLATIHQALTDRLDRTRCLNSFYEFVRCAWSEVDPSPFVDVWHLRVLCDKLQTIAENDGQDNIAVAIPPGYGKSMIIAVLFPAWLWARNPREQILSGAREQGLATRDAVRCRTVMRSPWYQRLFVREGWDFQRDQDQKTYYVNSEGGHRVTTSLGAGGTGWRAKWLLLDDLVRADRLPTGEELEAGWNWVTYVKRTRVQRAETTKCVLIMQRVHLDDPIGRIKVLNAERAAKGLDPEWSVLELPAEATEHSLADEYDQRSEVGEPLCEYLHTREKLEATALELGPIKYTSQYQQSPTSIDTEIVKRDWWRYYDPKELPEFSAVIQSWDCTFKGHTSSDYVAGSVWGIVEGALGEEFYLLDLTVRQLSFVETKAAIRSAVMRYPSTSHIVVEDKANGSAIIDELSDQYGQLLAAWNPDPYGNKMSRLVAASAMVYSGRAYLPEGQPWVASFVDEISGFPHAPHDDQVDSFSGAVLWWTRHRPGIQKQPAIVLY